jgi:uncharacterized protein (DUF2236 family)
MLLGGPRALLLQLAHPLVAAGVRDHSSYRSDPLKRLRRTLDATLSIVFGTRAEAQAAAAGINAVHSHVHGTLPQDAGRYRAGARYDATDPELLLWVHATLVDTTLATYECFVSELRPDEREQAYEESKIAARMLLVPDEIIPKDLAAFRSYMDEMLASDRIAAAPFQRALVHDVLYPPLRFVPSRAYWPMVAITTGLLPERVRAEFGLALTPARRRAFVWSRAAVRAMLPVVPRVLRDQPQSRRSH